MTHQCDLCTSGIVIPGLALESTSHTSSQGHVSSLLHPLWMKGSAPQYLWTQGRKKWHRDHERLCSYPVLSSDAYFWLYFIVLYSRALCPDPPVIGPTWCYLWCWPRRGAAKLRLGTLKASCMSVSPLKSSVGFHTRSSGLFPFPDG